MNREEAKEYIKNQLEDYLINKGINIQKPFLCLNPDHSDQKPSMSFNRNKNYVHCFSCGKTYDIISLIKAEYHLDTKEAFDYAYNLYGIEVDGYNNTKKKKRIRPTFNIGYDDCILIGFKKPQIQATNNVNSKQSVKMNINDFMSERELKAWTQTLTLQQGKKSKAVMYFTQKKGRNLLNEMVTAVYEKQRQLYKKLTS